MQPVHLAPEITAPRDRIHWPSAWQFGLSLLGILVLWGLSLIILGTVVSSVLLESATDTLLLLLNAAGTTFAGCLLIPSAVYALLRLLDKPAPSGWYIRRPGWIILALPPVLLLGQWAATTETIAYFLLPIMHVLAAAISVSWLLALGLRGLSAGSRQLSWGVFNAGLVGAPFLSLIAEFVALIIVGILALSFLVQDPQFMEALVELTGTLSVDPSNTALELLEPYVMRPGTLYLSLFFGALIVPLLEELFKPVGVWLLAGRSPTPGQGFAAGLLSGAGYALFENFMLGAGAGQDWAFVSIARMATSLIHILTAGLMGWSLARAWQGKRYLQLGVTYLIAVAIHALWNGLVILTAVSDLFGSQVALPGFLTVIAAAAPAVFAILILGCFLALLGINLKLKGDAPPDPPIPLEIELETTASVQE
jgi:RsiW-degrading membrane proteinase PrsW (M82 family)